MHARRSTLPRTAVVRTAIGGLLAGLLVSVAPLPAATATAATPPLPTRLASLGDSITRGFNACGFYVDCPSRSWSTGSSSAVGSHYVRVLAGNPGALGHNANDAQTGARMSDLPGQAAAAVAGLPDYVTILMGANDACTGSEATMTAVATFTEQFRAALTTLAAGAPNARVFVASVPDVNRLWQVGKDRLAARTAWSLFGICQSLLARPLSTQAADVARRARVHQRVVDYNAALAGVCATFTVCRFDGNAVFGYPFVLGQISTWDYFHPNTSGQAALAEVTWQHSYWVGAA